MACGGIVAARKHRSVGGWVILTGMFLPLILILLALPPLTEAEQAAAPTGGQIVGNLLVSLLVILTGVAGAFALGLLLVTLTS